MTTATVEVVLSIVDEISAVAPDQLVLADSIGVGVPRQVRELVGPIAQRRWAVGCHFHNTRNTGYANALAAVEAGATVLTSRVWEPEIHVPAYAWQAPAATRITCIRMDNW